jgi:hypothetical protein
MTWLIRLAGHWTEFSGTMWVRRLKQYAAAVKPLSEEVNGPLREEPEEAERKLGVRRTACGEALAAIKALRQKLGTGHSR